jgi:uncharacterized protein
MTFSANFAPLFRDPHWMTIAAHFWPRRLDLRRFPVSTESFESEPGVRVVVKRHRPAGEARARLVLIHGLESSAEAGYVRGMAQAALERGCAVDRFQLRSCGGTHTSCPTLYHGGLTSDLAAFLRSLAAPAWVIGFSLGGNVALKLAGELGDGAAALMAGVCGVSTPLDLEACARRIGEPDNWIYERRFVRKLMLKVVETGRCPRAELRRKRSLWEVDDRFTAPLWGFGTAANYYRSQSALRFLERIRIPGLLVQAEDDPFIPFRVFDCDGLRGNPCLKVLATRHGGHLGFLTRRGPRFWHEKPVLDWILTEQSGMIHRH